MIIATTTREAHAVKAILSDSWISVDIYRYMVTFAIK